MFHIVALLSSISSRRVRGLMLVDDDPFGVALLPNPRVAGADFRHVAVLSHFGKMPWKHHPGRRSAKTQLEILGRRAPHAPGHTDHCPLRDKSKESVTGRAGEGQSGGTKPSPKPYLIARKGPAVWPGLLDGSVKSPPESLARRARMTLRRRGA